jgi:hypothetical protein
VVAVSKSGATSALVNNVHGAGSGRVDAGAGVEEVVDALPIVVAVVAPLASDDLAPDDPHAARPNRASDPTKR